MLRLTTKLKALEHQARALLAKAGQTSETYDSPRLVEALGHLKAGVDALHAAAWEQAAREDRLLKEARWNARNRR